MHSVKSNILLEKITAFVRKTGCYGCDYFSDRLFMCVNKNSPEHNRLNNFNGCNKHSQIEEFEKLLV